MVYISWILYALVGSLGIYIEQASSQRLIWLLGPFLAGLSLLIAGEFFSQKMKRQKQTEKGFLFLFKLLGIACVIVMEYHSKYSINDLLNWLYLPLLLSAYSHLDRRGLLWFIPISLGSMSWKYFYMAGIDPSVIRVPGLIANLGVLLLMGVILYLSRQLTEEKERLQVANQTLTQLSREIEGLTVYRERQYIAREIHDTVGHGLTALVMKLEMSKVYGQSEVPEERYKAQNLLLEAIDDGRLALRNTREVVETMNSPRRRPEELRQLIEKSSKVTHMSLELMGETLLEELDDLQSHAVYRAVQEALTNCMKHSSANKFMAHLSKKGQKICICIEDNGLIEPSERHRAQSAVRLELDSANEPSGMGLRAMAERVKRSGGTMTLDFESGFEIEICFDVEELT